MGCLVVHGHCAINPYYIQHYCMELHISPRIFIIHTMIQIYNYDAFVVYSIFSGIFLVLTWTLLDLSLGLACLHFEVGCSCCFAACSYIVLPWYILQLQVSCRAGFIIMSRCYGCCALYIGVQKEDISRV